MRQLFLIVFLVSLAAAQTTSCTGSCSATGTTQFGGFNVATLQSITVTPANSVVCANCSQTLTATGNYSDGSTQNLTTLAAWTTSNGSVATTSQNGNYQCVAAGTITATATYQTIAGNTNLTCESPTFTPQGLITVTQGNSQITVATFVGSAGVPPYTFSSSDLPGWLSLSNTGCNANQVNCKLVGIPSTPGLSSFHIQMTDTVPATACANPGCPVSVNVQNSPPPPLPGSSPAQLPLAWTDGNRALDGSINSFSITAAGTGCVAGNLTIAAPGGGGTQATGTYSCTGGALTGVVITNPGKGYTVAHPSATIATGTGTLQLTVYVPPTYELTLTGGGGTWNNGPPPTCTFTLANYTNTGAGKQAAVTDIELCRTLTGVGIILDVPPGVYTTGSGFLVPQTNANQATQFNVIRGTHESNLLALLVPNGLICDGGIQDNIPEATVPGVSNPDCTGQNMSFNTNPQMVAAQQGTITGITTVSVNTTSLASITAGGSPQLLNLVNGYVSPTLGSASSSCVQIEPTTSPTQECVTPVSGGNQSGILAVFSHNHASGVCVVYNVTVAEGAPTNCGNGTGAFTLANGTATSVANYNFRQHMYEDVCTNTGCAPFALCSGVSAAGNYCGTPEGPDHWLFEDGLARPAVGLTSALDLINTGKLEGQATASTQFAQAIDFKNYAAIGDWTSLISGQNNVTNAFGTGMCLYCSYVGIHIAQVLRPGNEGHLFGGAVGMTQSKIVNVWGEGQSSGIFPGGQANPSGPAIFGSVPFVDSQVGRIRLTFPYSWLNSYNSNTNKFGKIPAGNTQWGGQSIVRKNCEEMKETIRAVFYGGFCENVDNSGGQSGVSFVGSTRNSSGGVIGQNYQSVISDFTIIGWIIRNTCRDGSMGARSANASNGGGVSQVFHNFLYQDILHYNVTNTNPLCDTAQSIGFDQNAFGQTWNAKVTENNDGTATAVAFASQDIGVMATGVENASGGNTSYPVKGSTFAANTALCGSPSGAFIYVNGFSHSANNSSTSGFQCAFSGSLLSSDAQMVSGSAVLNDPNIAVFTTAMVGAGVSVPGAGPAGATLVTSIKSFQDSQTVTLAVAASTTVSNVSVHITDLVLANASGIQEGPITTFNNYNNANPIIDNTHGIGYQVLNISNGEFVSVEGCSNTAFNNTPTEQRSGNTVPTQPGAAVSSPSATWTGTWSAANLTVTYPWGATAGTNDLTGNCILINNQGDPHDGKISHVTWITDTDQTVGGGPTPSIGPNFQKNLTYRDSIMVNSGHTNAGWFNLAFGEGTPMEKRLYDTKTLLTTGLVWPTRNGNNYTEYSTAQGCGQPNGCSPPKTMYFPATSCAVGFVFACSGSVPLTRPDYHDFALSGSSPFHAGNATPASDGTDIGARLPNIDMYQTQNPFVCPTPCGSLGPYPE